MTKTQIAKAAKKMADDILCNEPSRTFSSLNAKADALYGTDDGHILDAAMDILTRKAFAARGNYIKLKLSEPELVDDCVAAENMPADLKLDSVGYWADFYRHTEFVMQCHAEARDAK